MPPGGIIFAIPCYAGFKSQSYDQVSSKVITILIYYPGAMYLIHLTSMPKAIHQLHDYALTKKTKELKGPSKLLLPICFFQLEPLCRTVYKTFYNQNAMGVFMILQNIFFVLQVLIFGILLGSFAETLVYKCKDIAISKEDSVLRKVVRATICLNF